MSDSVVTSSKATIKSIAPGGLQVSSTQDSTVYSTGTLVSLFGTNNVQSVSRNVTTTIDNVATTQAITELSVTTTYSSSTDGSRVYKTVVPRIDRMSEYQYDRGGLLALMTGSRPRHEQALVTGSLDVVVDPMRRLSTDSDMRNLYLVSSSEAFSGSIERTIDPGVLETHMGIYETKITQLEIITASILTCTVHSYPQATDSISNPNSYDYDQEQQLYVFDNTLYTDQRHITPFQGQHTYYKLKNQDQAIGVTSKGQVFHWYVHGEKSKPRIRLILRVNGVTDKLEDACIDPDGMPSFKNVWYVDGTIYEDDFLTQEFQGSGTDYYKNIVWDEVHRVNQSGFVLESQPC